MLKGSYPGIPIRLFKALIEALRADLSSIKESLDQGIEKVSSKIDAATIAYKTEQNKAKPNPTINAILGRTQGEIEQENARTKREERAEQRNRWTLPLGIATLFCTLILTIANIGVLIYYAKQLKQMETATQQATRSADIAACALRQNQEQFVKTLIEIQRQTTAQNISANAAKDAARIASDTLHISERAYLFSKSPQLDVGTSSLFLPVENIGHIPAKNVHVIVHMGKTSKLPNGAYNAQYRWFERDFPEVWPGEPLSVGGVNVDQERAKRGDDTFTFGITIEYNDGFPGSQRVKRENVWCMEHLANNHFGFGTCLITNAFDLLKKADQYPNPKYRNY